MHQIPINALVERPTLVKTCVHDEAGEPRTAPGRLTSGDSTGGDEVLAFEFSPFRLEPATRRLLRGGDPLPLTPKSFDTLLVLVQNRDRVVEKSEVMRLVWPDTVVEEANLAQHVFTLRKALGDSPDGARFIATVPKRGYRFVAEVREVPNGNGATTSPFVAPTAWGTARAGRTRRWALATGLAAAAVALAAIGFHLGRKQAREDPRQNIARSKRRKVDLKMRLN